MPTKRRSRAASRASGKQMRDRLVEAEATLDAIRTGQVDALVVVGPRGTQTRTIEGAHPYFVLLDAMGDGALLLEPDGRILFSNRSFETIAGTSLKTLRGTPIQQLAVPSERARFEAFLRDGRTAKDPYEFLFVGANKAARPVAIALSVLAAEASAATGRTGVAPTVLMAIVTDLTFRKAAEATRERLIQQLIAAEDTERRRVARELHDETGQSLTALLVGLRTIADMTARPAVRTAAMRMRDVAAQTIDDVGRLARGLHPAVLDDMGLEAAARRHTTDFVISFGTPVEFRASRVDTPRLSPLAASTMYRILQEALTNVARYARAQKVTVTITRDAAVLTLLVRDDGVGFDVRAKDATSTLGLRGMQERVTLLGGSLDITSQRGRGTEVRARIPMIPR